MNLRLETHDVSIIIPGSSIASEALNAVHVQFRVNSVPSAEAASVESRSLRQYPDLASTGTILSLELDAIGENVRTSVHQFDGPITVEWTLPHQKLNSIQPDYAGVYYVDGQNAQYVGGEFGGGKVTFTTDHFSYYAVLEMHKDFADLKGHWAETYVSKLAAKHIVNGVDEEHFAPDRPITRADLITMAVRSLGFTEPEYAEVFSDVSKDKYYAGFVSKAAEIGLAEGYNGRFRPEDSLTREEAVTVLMRLADYRNKAWPGADTADFADRGEISEWAREHVKRAKAAGIVEGRGDNRFEPKANVTRSELAKMLYLTIK
ncbi:S-layer homology domain-containing protein [Paenibacillus thermoaerophilus]